MPNRTYMDYLHEPDYDDAPPLTMTPEIARALIVAHDEGRGMSDELLARARECVMAMDNPAFPMRAKLFSVRENAYCVLADGSILYHDITAIVGDTIECNSESGEYLFSSDRVFKTLQDAESYRNREMPNTPHARYSMQHSPEFAPITLVFNDAQWRSDISWIWMRELARGNIATTPIKGADLQVGQVVADGTHTLYRLLEPLTLGVLHWSGKVYRTWRVESVNTPRSSVSLKPFFVEQEYRMTEE